MIEFIDSLIWWGFDVGGLVFLALLFCKFFIKLPLKFFK